MSGQRRNLFRGKRATADQQCLRFKTANLVLVARMTTIPISIADPFLKALFDLPHRIDQSPVPGTKTLQSLVSAVVHSRKRKPVR